MTVALAWLRFPPSDAEGAKQGMRGREWGTELGLQVGSGAERLAKGLTRSGEALSYFSIESPDCPTGRVIVAST